MERIINYENLRSFAYVNDRIVKKPIRGIVLNFFGLGDQNMFEEETYEGRLYAENGLLYIVPYTNPWSWMNRQAVNYTDEIIEVLIKRYELSATLPVVSTGCSMGGQSAIVYTVYAKYTPVACVTNCPVCDLVFHYSERKDLPRTLYNAFYDLEGNIFEALKTASPIHLIDKMPKIKYYTFHCKGDPAVNVSHSLRLSKEMKIKDVAHELYVVDGDRHCGLTEDMQNLYYKCVLDAVTKINDKGVSKNGVDL